MAGSIRLVRGKDVWELRVFAGRDSSGKVRHVHLKFRGSRRAAERELARLVAEQGLTRRITPEPGADWGPNTTINDAINAWRENGWEDLSPSTTRRYESIVKVHIAPSIGKKKIVLLSPYEVERFLRNLKNAGLSQSSVHQVRAVMARACHLARRWSGNTLPNPIADTELPSWGIAGQASVRAPELEEVRSLLRGAKTDSQHLLTFFSLIVATGMRRGEACALRWRDVDFEDQTIHVNESIVAASGREHSSLIRRKDFLNLHRSSMRKDGNPSKASEYGPTTSISSIASWMILSPANDLRFVVPTAERIALVDGSPTAPDASTRTEMNRRRGGAHAGR